MSPYALPDERGHFGRYGGIFVAETLMQPLAELRQAYERYRNDPDFESELQQAQMNAHFGGVRTVFLPCGPGVSFLASNLIRQITQMGGDVIDLVPPPVGRRLQERLAP